MRPQSAGSRLLFALLALALSCTTAQPRPDAGPASAPAPDLPHEDAAPSKALAPHTASSEAPDTSGFRLARQTYHVRYQKDGTCTVEDTMVMRPRTPQEADALSVQAVYFAPWREETPVVTATVTLSDGQVFELDPRTIDESPAREASPGVYSDVRMLSIPMPGVRAGAQIEITIRRSLHPTALLGGDALSLSLSIADGVDALEVTAEAPPEWPLGWTLEGQDIGAQVEETQGKDGGQRLTLKTGPVDTPTDIPLFAPPGLMEPPVLVIAPRADWSALGARYGSVVETQLAEADVGGFADRYGAPEQGRLSQVQALLSGVQEEIRYTGLAYGEGAVIPRSPAETLARGYGDCKDQSTLLLALLREAGIKAHIALLQSGGDEDISPALPAINRFNHAIVYIPGETPLWVDPTRTFLRAGELSSDVRGRWALIADPAGGRLIQTPPRVPEARSQRILNSVILPEIGKGAVTERTEARGDAAYDVRLVATLDPDALREAMEAGTSAIYAESTLEGYSVAESDPQTGATVIVLEISGVQEAVAIPESAMVSIGGQIIFAHEELNALLAEVSQSERTVPVHFRSPAFSEVQREIQPPKDFVPLELPDSVSERIGGLTYARAVEWNGERVVLRSSLTLEEGPYTPEEVGALPEAIARWTAEDAKPLQFKHKGELAVQGGDFKAGIEAYLAPTRLDPKDPRALARLAQGYALIGMGVAARETAAQALRLAPEEPLTQWIYARSLERDDLGRRIYRADALPIIEAYWPVLRAAPHALEPKVQQVLFISGYHEQGRGDDDLLRKGAALWKEVMAAPASTQKLITLGRDQYCLLQLSLGEAEEAYQTLASTPTDDVPDVYGALCQAASGDVEGALDTLMVPGQTTPSEVAKARYGLATMLLGQRLYDEARALLGAAIARSEGPERDTLTALLTDVEPLRRIDTFDPAPEGPDAFVQTLFHRIHKKADLTDLIHPDLDTDFDLYKLKNPFKTPPYQRAVPRPGAYTDHLLTHLTIETEGSEATGYRIRLQGTGLFPSSPLDLFVVRDGGRLRLRALYWLTDAFGAQAHALRIAGGPDAEAAVHQWLVWGIEGRKRSKQSESSTDFILQLARTYLGDPAREQVLSAAMRSYSQPDDASIACLQAALEREENARLQEALHRALVFSHRKMSHYDEALAHLASVRVLSADPFMLLTDERRIYLLKGDLAGMQRSMDVYLAENPNDYEAIHQLAMNYALAGEYGRVAALCREILQVRPNDEEVRNSLSWNALFTGSVQESDIQRLKGPGGTGDKSADRLALHTLASLEAELGHLPEALETLREAADRRDPKGVRSYDGFVIGRIAEHLGLMDIARDAYEATLEEDADLQSSSLLAERRLAAMDAAAP